MPPFGGSSARVALERAAPVAPERAVEEWLRAQEKKDLLRLVTIGSVDDGKSTLIGRLLHDAHGLYQDQLDAVRRASLRGGARGAGPTSEIDFSLFTDGLLAEREQGITIDVAYRHFTTERRRFIIADAPGHVQYTRNMATGASTADVAVVLVDARVGVLSQTRRHAHIAALLGIPSVIACVNKMDLVGWDGAVFERICADLEAIAERLAVDELHPIPVSALTGDNVVTASARMPWWTGGTLLDRLETLETIEGSARATRRSGAFRLPVQLVLRQRETGYRAFAGQIASGTIKTGDEVVVLPSGERTRVASVDVAGHDAGVASAPMSVALRLAGEIDVSRGDMIALATHLPRVATSLEANIVWMSQRPLDPGKTYVLKHTTRSCRASIEAIDVAAAETLERIPASTLGLNDIGRAIVRCRAPVFFDAYATNRATGAFVLVDSVTNDTVAAGMIIGAHARLATEARRLRPRGQIGSEERRERLGQTGAVVVVRASTREEALDLSYAIERELFDRGRVTVVIDAPSDEAARSEACARGGLIALVPAAAREARFALEIDGAPIPSDVAPAAITSGTGTPAIDAVASELTALLLTRLR